MKTSKKSIIQHDFTQSTLVSYIPQYRYSHQSKTCNEACNHADFSKVHRAFKALQNGIKISTKKAWPWILLPEDTGRNKGFERYLVYFDFKN